MLSEIQCLNISGDLNHELLYYLIKSESSEANLKLFSILQKFQKSSDFFEYYTNINTSSLKNSLQEVEKNLFSLLNAKKVKNETNKDINQYLSSISNIILVFNIFMRIQDILNKIITEDKNNFNNCKIKYDNIKNLNSSFIYIENFYNFLSSKDIDQKFLCSLPTNSASTVNTPKNILNQKNENFFFQEIITPRFENDCADIKNSNDLIFDSLKTESELTLFNMKFSNKDFSNKLSQKKNSSNRTDQEIKKNEKTETQIYLELLIIIYESYKLCLINAEEKIRLKKLIISRFEEVKTIYFEYHDFLQTNKKNIIKKLKKLLYKFV